PLDQSWTWVGQSPPAADEAPDPRPDTAGDGLVARPPPGAVTAGPVDAVWMVRPGSTKPTMASTASSAPAPISTWRSVSRRRGGPGGGTAGPPDPGGGAPNPPN